MSMTKRELPQEIPLHRADERIERLIVNAVDLQGEKTMGIFAKPPPTEPKAKYTNKRVIRSTSSLRLASPDSQPSQIRQTRLVFMCRTKKRRGAGGSVVQRSPITAPTHSSRSRHMADADTDGRHHTRTRRVRQRRSISRPINSRRR